MNTDIDWLFVLGFAVGFALSFPVGRAIGSFVVEWLRREFWQ